MKDGPGIASIAALIGDPARANMLTALMDGRALTISELAQAAGVALPTASGHLTKLGEAGLVTTLSQGRHRYVRLSGSDVADLLERLMGVAQRTGAVRTRTGPRDPALREARICYDHLAGAQGVALMRALKAQGWIGIDAPTAAGEAALAAQGIEVPAPGRRPICRTCLDWSEREEHLAGSLGAAILGHVLTRGWAKRGPGRVITFSRQGDAAFRDAFGIEKTHDGVTAER